jgi:hypothetical protein
MMKSKPILVSFFLFCVLSLSAQEEDRKAAFGLKAGLNSSIFTASINSESSAKLGFHIGIYIKKQIGNKAYFRPEMYFSSQGQKDEYLIPPNGPTVGETTTSVNYLNVPILFEFGKKIFFQVGPQIGFLLSAKEEGEIDGDKVNDDLKNIMKGTDVSLVGGLGFNATENFNLGVRVNIGMTEAFKDSGSNGFPSVKNQVLHFYLGYTF